MIRVTEGTPVDEGLWCLQLIAERVEGDVVGSWHTIHYLWRMTHTYIVEHRRPVLFWCVAERGLRSNTVQDRFFSVPIATMQL